MSSGMPELGSKISLISKADIRYEGRLFTVDPQECTIALASVRSFGTEDRETQYPVAPQSQVYDYILFRGSDIKDIRVLNNVSLPNDPAIMQMSVPASLGGGGGGAAPAQFGAQFTHPVVGQSQYPQYHPMAGFPGGVHATLNKTSELSPQTPVELAPHPQPQPSAGPIGSAVAHHANQVKDQGSMLDLISGGSQQSASRSGTPAVGGHRKSPTADQGTQVGSVASGSGQRDGRSAQTSGQKPRNRTNSRNRQRYPSGGQQPQQQHQQHQQHQPQQHQQHQQQQHQQYQHPSQHHQSDGVSGGGGGGGGYRGGWRGRGRGGGGRGGRGGFTPRNKNTLKFDNDYDFEQANTEFEELRSQLAKTKISDADTKVEVINPPGETDKKDDSGNETGAGEAELEDDGFTGYDKNKSFFDNISCEAVERSKGRSQRTDWRTERKLNSETFGVAMARRGAWRGRANWRHNAQHQHHFYSSGNWRAMRGGGRGRGSFGNHNQQHNQHTQQHNQHNQQHNQHNQQHNQHNQQHNQQNGPRAAASASQPPQPQPSAAAK